MGHLVDLTLVYVLCVSSPGPDSGRWTEEGDEPAVHCPLKRRQGAFVGHHGFLLDGELAKPGIGIVGADAFFLHDEFGQLEYVGIR